MLIYMEWIIFTFNYANYYNLKSLAVSLTSFFANYLISNEKSFPLKSSFKILNIRNNQLSQQI